MTTTETPTEADFVQALRAALDANVAALVADAETAGMFADPARLRAIAESYRAIADVFTAANRVVAFDEVTSYAFGYAINYHDRLATSYDEHARHAAEREAYRAGDPR